MPAALSCGPVSFPSNTVRLSHSTYAAIVEVTGRCARSRGDSDGRPRGAVLPRLAARGAGVLGDGTFGPVALRLGVRLLVMSFVMVFMFLLALVVLVVLAAVGLGLVRLGFAGAGGPCAAGFSTSNSSGAGSLVLGRAVGSFIVLPPNQAGRPPTGPNYAQLPTSYSQLPLLYPLQ